MFQFSPPANISELSDSLKSDWSEVVHGWFQSAAERLIQEQGQSQGDIRLFNLLDTPSGASGPSAEIQWNGFPRKYKLAIPSLQDRWNRVEQSRNFDLTGRQAAYFKKLPDGTFVRATNILFRDQDEYCEWHSFRSAGGDLLKVVFTCENPEYWQFIADNDPNLLLSIYQQLSTGTVEMADLFFDEDIYVPGLDGQAVNQNGKYNPHNKWNTTQGAIHLTHPANSLSAEVFLAADATILRANGGIPITSAGELICCAAYGGPDRSSDPTIGAFVNGLVRQGLSVTINDPVGLYIHSLDANPFEFPTGISFDDCWKVVRGNKDAKQILRAEFSLPNGGPLSGVLVGGEPLNFGAQIAEFVSIVIYGKAFNAGTGLPASQTCIGHCCVNPSLPTLQSIRDINDPCPSVPGPGNLEAAMKTAPAIEKLPNLETIKNAYTR